MGLRRHAQREKQCCILQVARSTGDQLAINRYLVIDQLGTPVLDIFLFIGLWAPTGYEEPSVCQYGWPKYECEVPQ